MLRQEILQAHNMVDIILISLEDNVSSLGIRNISAYLKQKGFRPVLLFLPCLSKTCNTSQLENISDFIKKTRPRFIGMSFMSTEHNKAMWLTSALKKEVDIPIVWGGVHATVANPERSLDYADMICVGDGEVAAYNLLKNTHKNPFKPEGELNNIWFKDKAGKIIKNTIFIPEENYDFLPFMDFSPEDNYIQLQNKITPLTDEIQYKYLIRLNIDHENPTYLIFANKGCVFNCSFCCNQSYNKIYGKNNRKRCYSVRRIIDELECATNKLPWFKSVWICDPDIMQNSDEWFAEFSREYKKRIVMPFSTFMSLHFFSQKNFNLLADAGMSDCEIGIESLSKRVTTELFGRTYEINKLLNIIRKKGFEKVYMNFDILTKVPYTNAFDKFASFVNYIKISLALAGSGLKGRFFEIDFKILPGTKLAGMLEKDGKWNPDATPGYLAGTAITNWLIGGFIFHFPLIPEKMSNDVLKLIRKIRNILCKRKFLL